MNERAVIEVLAWAFAAESTYACGRQTLLFLGLARGHLSNIRRLRAQHGEAPLGSLLWARTRADLVSTKMTFWTNITLLSVHVLIWVTSMSALTTAGKTPTSFQARVIGTLLLMVLVGALILLTHATLRWIGQLDEARIVLREQRRHDLEGMGKS